MGGRGSSSGIAKGGMAKNLPFGLSAFMKPLNESDLPELEGSPKQIAWAEDIRKKELEVYTEIEKNLLYAIAGLKKNLGVDAADTDDIGHFSYEMYKAHRDYTKKGIGAEIVDDYDKLKKSIDVLQNAHNLVMPSVILEKSRGGSPKQTISDKQGWTFNQVDVSSVKKAIGFMEQFRYSMKEGTSAHVIINTREVASMMAQCLPKDTREKLLGK